MRGMGVLLVLGLAALCWAGEPVVEGDVNTAPSDLGHLKGKSPEDSIPVIEIRGEGKPMTAAQIRALEEQSEGKPLDIKVKHTWRPRDCPRAAKRKDFVTFQFKGFLEDGKKFDQSYGRDPVRMQLGVGMTMPGLDKGLRGMCDTELRKINVPWRLSRTKRSKVWKFVPKEEHWLTFDIEMITVEAWTPELQFEFMDINNDTLLTPGELTKHLDRLRSEFGKHWPNDDIDNVLAANYFVKYFDADHDGKVSKDEYVRRMKSDMKAMGKVTNKPEGRKRDPGVGWILDFNNDGVVTAAELDEAAAILENPEETLKRNAAMDKDEL